MFQNNSKNDYHYWFFGQSVLENLHLMGLMQMLDKPDSDLFGSLSTDEKFKV